MKTASVGKSEGSGRERDRDRERDGGTRMPELPLCDKSDNRWKQNRSQKFTHTQITRIFCLWEN